MKQALWCAIGVAALAAPGVASAASVDVKITGTIGEYIGGNPAPSAAISLIDVPLPPPLGLEGEAFELCLTFDDGLDTEPFNPLVALEAIGRGPTAFMADSVTLKINGEKVDGLFGGAATGLELPIGIGGDDVLFGAAVEGGPLLGIFALEFENNIAGGLSNLGDLLNGTGDFEGGLFMLTGGFGGGIELMMSPFGAKWSIADATIAWGEDICCEANAIPTPAALPVGLALLSGVAFRRRRA